MPEAGINACNLQKWTLVVRKIQKWIYSWMTPSYVEDEDEYYISKQLLEKCVCSIPVSGIIDGKTAIVCSVLKFLKCHVYMLLLICPQFHYANGDSPYAKFSAFLPVRIQGVPVCIRGSVSDGSAIFP